MTVLQTILSSRRQRAVLDGVSSPPARVTSGVPQGSILGPLLFILSMDQLCSLSLSNASRLPMTSVNSVLDALSAQCDIELIVE